MDQKPIPKNAKGRYTVPGRKNLDVDLEENDPTRFAVVQKDIDPGLPASFDDVRIEWFNAFGIRRRKGNLTMAEYADAVQYSIVIPDWPSEKQLFTYYAGHVWKLAFTWEGTSIRASLDVGDPPVGWGP